MSPEGLALRPALDDVFAPEGLGSAMFDVISKEDFGIGYFITVVLGAVPFIHRAEGFLALLNETV